VPSANINAATIMLAEKASDLLLGKPGLQPEALPYHSQTKQPDNHKASA